MILTFDTLVDSRTEVQRLVDAAFGPHPRATTDVSARAHGGGRRAGQVTTLTTESVGAWYTALSGKAAEVVRYVAGHHGVATSEEIRAHLSRVFYRGLPVSSRCFGGVLGNGGRAIRVDQGGEPWRPLLYDAATKCYSLEPQVRAQVQAALGRERSAGTTPPDPLPAP